MFRRLGRRLVAIHRSVLVGVGLDGVLKPENERAYRRLMRWVTLLQGVLMLAVGVHHVRTYEPLPAFGTGDYFRALFDLPRQLGEWFGWAGVVVGVVYIIVTQLILLRRPLRSHGDAPTGTA